MFASLLLIIVTAYFEQLQYTKKKMLLDYKLPYSVVCHTKQCQSSGVNFND